MIKNKGKFVLKDKNGSMYVELLVFFLVVTITVLTSINFYNVIIKYQHITYMSKSLAKTIELEGAVTDTVYEKLDALNENFGTHAEMEISNVRYFDSFDKSIQFRDPFTVVVSDHYEFEILSPLFSDPVTIDIPMESTITGMSEVYWKE